jgi:hypothetical protein
LRLLVLLLLGFDFENSIHYLYSSARITHNKYITHYTYSGKLHIAHGSACIDFLVLCVYFSLL